jgi:hypothetical protein
MKRQNAAMALKPSIPPAVIIWKSAHASVVQQTIVPSLAGVGMAATSRGRPPHGNATPPTRLTITISIR